MNLNTEKILDLIQVGLHLFSIAETGQAKSQVAEAMKAAREGKIEEAGKMLADAAGKGFADENLHKRAVRAALEPGVEKEKYLAYINKLSTEEPKVHTNYILAVATENDPEERKAIVKEFATCPTYNAFRALINSYGYNQPQTPQQKFLLSLIEVFKTGLQKGIADGAKTAGEGVEKAGQAIKDKNQRMDANIGNSGFVAWTAKIRAKAEKLNEKKS